MAVLLLVAGAVAWRTGTLDALYPSGASTLTGRTSPSVPSGSAPSPAAPASPSATSAATPGPINTAFPGLVTFRGNATRDWYGEGPVPKHPVIRWRYPAHGSLCSTSVDNHGSRMWCGTGWTGQPNVIQHRDGTVEVREGAYDDHYHFLNGTTGQPVRPDLVTGDLAKGSATSDADGYPLYYAGSRDNLLRVVAMDRAAPTVLWSFDSDSQPGGLWNDDWDGAPLQVGDYLLEGGENSWFYVVRLHRGYDAHQKVTVAPKIVMRVPGFDDQLLDDLHDHDVSIEDSVAFDAVRGVVYFANSGGLVQGWDIGDVLKGGTKYHRVFRFWDGDETDASIVIDPQGDLLVARHRTENVPTRSAARDHQVGSLMKLDPRRPKDPVVWSVPLGGFEADGGILGTPAYHDGVVYSTFDEGGLAAVDERTGKLLWTVHLPGPTWMSPVVVRGQLLVGDCAGDLHDYRITNPRKAPAERWSLHLGGCVESTPAVWHGMIYVGTRAGQIFGIGDPP